MTPELIKTILDNYNNYTDLGEFLKFLDITDTGKNRTVVNHVLKYNRISYKFCSVKNSKLLDKGLEYLRQIIHSSKNKKEILEHFGISARGRNYDTLKKIAEEHNIQLSHLSETNTISNHRQEIVDFDEYVKITKSNSSIKKFIIRNNIIEYQCSCCGIGNEYNGKKLILQLEHIDGNHKNNNLSNLTFLCPNCHSQTSTFAGRKLKNMDVCCSRCNKKIYKNNKTGMCHKCNSEVGNYDKLREHRRKFEITVELLIELLKLNSLTAIGKMYNVSDNAIRRRCRKYGIDLTINKFSHSPHQTIPL
jgi:Zn finger protein HypA/HybF involved in hydrogenase expression